ncbi:MAG: hypothetical protein HEP71_13125 [Roseivirga sp.]|nr:hypothetical protein [Roseivirga sp.]
MPLETRKLVIRTEIKPAQAQDESISPEELSDLKNELIKEVDTKLENEEKSGKLKR